MADATPPLPNCPVPRCDRQIRYARSEYCTKHYEQARRGRMWVPVNCEVCGKSLPTQRRGGRLACLGPCRDLRNNLKRFGLSVREYKAMYAAQGGACAGCFAVRPLYSAADRGRLYIDHDHATGKVRGLLCISCNLGLGKLKDDPAVLRRLASYLEDK